MKANHAGARPREEHKKQAKYDKYTDPKTSAPRHFSKHKAPMSESESDDDHSEEPAGNKKAKNPEQRGTHMVIAGKKKRTRAKSSSPGRASLFKRPKDAVAVIAAPVRRPLDRAEKHMVLDTRKHWHAAMEAAHQPPPMRPSSFFQPRYLMTWNQSIGKDNTQVVNTMQRPGARGDAVVERIMRLIKLTEVMTGKYRYPATIQMHRAFLAANLRLIYKDDWAHVERDILAQYGLSRTVQDILVRSARQVGKTTSIRMFVAALMLSMPDVTVAICGPTYQHGKSIVGPVKTNVLTLLKALRDEGEKWEVTVDNIGEFKIAFTARDGRVDVRSVKAYPGNEKVYVYFSLLFSSARHRHSGRGKGKGDKETRDTSHILTGLHARARAHRRINTRKIKGLAGLFVGRYWCPGLLHARELTTGACGAFLDCKYLFWRQRGLPRPTRRSK